MNSDDLAYQLECLCDTNTIGNVLKALVQVCNEKSEYVAAGGSHGDPSPSKAKAWRRVAKAVGRAAAEADWL